MSKMLVLAVLAMLSAAAQTTPTPTLQTPLEPNSVCTHEVTPDGKTVVTCAKTVVSGGETNKNYRDDFLILCRTKILNIDTVITVDVTALELQFIDLDKLIAWAGAQPPITNPSYAPSYSAWNLPASWQALEKFVVSRAEWEALPVEKRWAAIKQQPPAQYAKLPVSGACATEILKKLKAKPEEPY